MPQFFPDHAEDAARPSDSENLAAFLRGYLGAAEWLAMDDVPCPKTGEHGRVDDKRESRRDKIRGWTRKAQSEARRDCREFMRANLSDLMAYCHARYLARLGRAPDQLELRGYDMGGKPYGLEWMESAGTDFHLSRNGHGAGFFDRGNAPCFDALQEAARGYGEREASLSRGGWLYWM